MNIHHGMLWHYVHYACFYQELGLLCYDSNKLDIQWKFVLGHSRLKKTGLEITTVITMSIFHETLTNRLIRFVAVVQIYPRLNVLFRLFDDTARKQWPYTISGKSKSRIWGNRLILHGDIMPWTRFRHCWPFVGVNQRCILLSGVHQFSHFVFSRLLALVSYWTNSHIASDLGRLNAHVTPR